MPNSKTHLAVGQNQTAGVPQVLVYLSIYQGNPFWGYPIFDPRSISHHPPPTHYPLTKSSAELLHPPGRWATKPRRGDAPQLGAQLRLLQIPAAEEDFASDLAVAQTKSGSLNGEPKWAWLKIKQEGSRRFWSIVALTRVPFGYRWFGATGIWPWFKNK